jgi:hypothetical protein
MGHTMTKMTEDFKKAHNDILTWAHTNIQELNRQNNELCRRLDESNQKMNNFAFNIQVSCFLCEVHFLI